MKRYFTLLFILAILIMSANSNAQYMGVTWPLSSNQVGFTDGGTLTVLPVAPTSFFDSITYNTTWAPQPYGCKYGTRSSWPANETDEVAGRYVEFKVTLATYGIWYVNAVMFNLASVGGTKVITLSYWSNDNFVTRNNMPGTQALGTKDTWYPFTFLPAANIAAGGSFSIRFYPYNALTSAAIGKYMGIRKLIINHEVVRVKDKNTLPTQFGLDQNYPNPFNPTTVISYQLSAVSKVVLKVYDILGNEVAVLVNEIKHAGYYSVGFDAGKLTSGVYIYKMQAGGFVQTKKMILLR